MDRNEKSPLHDSSPGADYESIELGTLKFPVREVDPDADLDPESEPEGDISRTSKICQTAGACAAYFAVAMNLGLLGPSLLDFEEQTNSTTREVSTLFTSRGLLAIVGSLVLGPVFDLLNHLLVVGFSMLFTGVFLAVSPLSSSIITLLITLSPPEFFGCAVGMGTHLLCISIWKEKCGPILQLLNLISVLGYMSAPLLVKPFLYDSKIYIAFLLVSAFCLAISLWLICMFAKGGWSICNAKQQSEGKSSTTVFVYKMSALYFFFNVFYGGIEIGYAGLVMTFAVKFLHWEKSDATNIVALVQFCNALVTAAAIWFSHYLKPNMILLIDIIIVTFSLVLLVLFVEVYPWILWLCTALLGAGYATIMPSSFTWANSYLDVDGKFSSFYWCGFFLGFMAIPALAGYLFNDVDEMCFPYIMLASSVAMAFIFGLMQFLVWSKQPREAINENTPQS